MRFFIFLVVLCTASNSFAQNLQVRYKPCNPCGTELNDDFDYGDPIIFPTESVISDYGIRHVSSGSTFHQAIDYSSIFFEAYDNDIRVAYFSKLGNEGHQNYPNRRLKNAKSQKSM